MIKESSLRNRIGLLNLFRISTSSSIHIAFRLSFLSRDALSQGAERNKKNVETGVHMVS